MSNRRARGEGSVYRDGSAWVARIDLPIGADGKRRQVKRRRKTKTEAHRVLREIQDELHQGVDLDAAKRTVAEAVESFLAVQSTDRAAKTIEMEQWRGSLITRGLGRRQVGRLTVADCDEFLVRAQAGEYGQRPMGREALRRVRSLLINVVRNEMRTGAVARNVADLSVIPNEYPSRGSNDEEDGADEGSRRALSHDEFRELWRVSRYPLLVLVDLCGRNGLRPSEARALLWDRVDMDAMTLAVNRQMSSSDEPTKAKTRRSVRTIPIDETTVRVLQTWRTKQQTKQRSAGDRWADNGLVVSTRYGTGIGARNLRRMLTTACEEAAVDPIVPYELRHTAITYQVDAGRDSWEIADWAGTSERMIEQTYRHRLHRVSRLAAPPIEHLDKPLPEPDLGHRSTERLA